MSKRISLVLMLAAFVLVIGGLAAAREQVVQENNGGVFAAEDGKSKVPAAFEEKPAPGTKARCLVMDMVFVVNKKTETSVYKGKHYAFCCPGCKTKFDADPEKYLKKG